MRQEGDAPTLPTCAVRAPVCSPYNAPVLLGAGLADHSLQVVELGEPRSLQTDQMKMQAGRMLRERVGCEVGGRGTY